LELRPDNRPNGRQLGGPSGENESVLTGLPLVVRTGRQLLHVVRWGSNRQGRKEHRCRSREFHGVENVFLNEMTEERMLRSGTTTHFVL